MEINLICKICGREFKTPQGLGNHKKYCDGVSVPKKKRKEGLGQDWNKGRTYEEIFGKRKAKKIKEKISKSSKGRNSWCLMRQETIEKTKLKLRKNIQERYKGGWDPKAGRCPKYKYKDFTVDGSWELEFCKWADEIGLIFERNTDKFDYEFEGVKRKYKPDFKLNENTYIEIKGYQVDRDLAKWEYFPYSLIVLKRSQINRIKDKSFNKEDLYKYIR